jgi:hypothetical protein
MNQKRTIMGSCDYSIETLKNLKRDLGKIGSPNQEVLWALGGIVCALTSNLLHICDKVFHESLKENGTNAQRDLRAVQLEFNAFIERMLNNATV